MSGVEAYLGAIAYDLKQTQGPLLVAARRPAAWSCAKAHVEMLESQGCMLVTSMISAFDGSVMLMISIRSRRFRLLF